MTQHNKVVEQFMSVRPSWCRTGLRKKLNTLLEDAPIHSLGIIPDAFEIDTASTTVRLLEVDGDSYTDQVKLHNMCQLWYVLDCLGWSCELTVIDLTTGVVGTMLDADFEKHWNNLCEHSLG